MRPKRPTQWLVDTPIAHRGLHGPGTPELSQTALLRAVQAGVAIEIDVRLCQDAVVVIHDEDTSRVTGVRLVVADSNLIELQALTVIGSDKPLPSLDEALTIVQGRVPLLIEVKHRIPAEQIGPAVLASLSGYPGAWAIQSFDPRIIRWFRRHAPVVLRGQIAGDLSREGLRPLRRFVLETMIYNFVTRPDFLVWDADGLPNRLVNLWCAALNCPVLSWTVRTEEQLARARAAGAGVIFENLSPTAVSAAVRQLPP